MVSSKWSSLLNNGQTVWTEQFTNEGGPKAEFLFENGLNVNSTPQDWLMAFLPLNNGTAQCPDRENNVCFSHKWAKFTNMKAVQMGAGVQGGCYPSFIPFMYNEIEHFIGLYILQGLNPSPQVEMKFSSQRADPVQGSDLCHGVLGTMQSNGISSSRLSSPSKTLRNQLLQEKNALHTR